MWIGKTGHRGRAAIFWGFACFLLAQVSLAIVIERWRPDWGDPEYGYRFRNLLRRIKEAPDRPLLVILGSSRTSLGCKTDVLPPPSWKGTPAPLVYNMSLNGASFTYELLILKRLLAADIRPRWAIIEVHSVCLNLEDRTLATRDTYAPYRLRWADLETLDRYAPQHTRYRYRKWLVGRLTSWYTNRCCLLSRYAPSWAEPKNAQVQWWPTQLSPYGWQKWPLTTVTPEQRKQGIANTRAAFAVCLENFRVCPEADRLLREILDTCRKENIKVLCLLKTPEASDLRSIYSPETNEIINTYLTDLGREYHTELVDASSWAGDFDTFDGHHLLPGGAEKFTLRLWKEVVEPRLQEETSPSYQR